MSFFKRNKSTRVVLPCLIESLSDQGAQIDAVAGFVHVRVWRGYVVSGLSNKEAD
jgi:hypothetical protein